jgi:hypothetical protein
VFGDAWEVLSERNAAYWRFLNWHGQRVARLDSRQSVHEDSIEGPRTIFIRFFQVTLFNAPMEYLRDLEVVEIDNLFSGLARQKLFSKLLDEWDSLSLQVRSDKMAAFASLWHC